MPTPFLLVGDAPRRSTGLARIARDLTHHLTDEAGALELQVAQAGPDTGEGLQWARWPFYGLSTSTEDWGASSLPAVWQEAFGDRPGVILTVWDAARCFHLVEGAARALPEGMSWWGYFPVDARTRMGGFGGPAGATVRAYSRVLGYGRWGGAVLKQVRGGEPVKYLPHGIDEGVWHPAAAAGQDPVYPLTGFDQLRTGTILLGTVMANQPRKDFGSWAETLRTLLDRGWKVHGWLHTDFLVSPQNGGWSVPELLDLYGLQRKVTVTTRLDDATLAACYARCAVTYLPSLGEGFGYPIVESLACGTPCVHTTDAGGAELVPRSEWRVPHRADRLEGVYGLVRPVYLAEDWANAIERVIRWREAEGAEVVREYCRGAVAHLSWRSIWPRWRSWIRQGLEAL